MSLPKRAEAYTFPLEVQAVVSSNDFLIDPTIVAGDFKIKKDFGTIANLSTLPTVPISGTTEIQVSLTATEMTADKVSIFAVDQDSVWKSVSMFIDVPTGNIDNVYDLAVGDKTETSAKQIIKKKGTSTEILNKDVAGSLLSTSITVTTKEP